LKTLIVLFWLLILPITTSNTGKGQSADWPFLLFRQLMAGFQPGFGGEYPMAAIKKPAASAAGSAWF